MSRPAPPENDPAVSPAPLKTPARSAGLPGQDDRLRPTMR
jgi:hypothetical protein